MQLERMPNCWYKFTADTPRLSLATRQITQDQTIKEFRVMFITVSAVTETDSYT